MEQIYNKGKGLNVMGSVSKDKKNKKENEKETFLRITKTFDDGVHMRWIAK